MILSKASLFVALGSGHNYVQITGIANSICLIGITVFLSCHFVCRDSNIQCDWLYVHSPTHKATSNQKTEGGRSSASTSWNHTEQSWWSSGKELKESHSGTSNGTRDVPTLSITSSPTLSITSSAAQQSTASKCSHPQSTSNAPTTQNERSSVRCRIKRRSLRTVNARRRRLYQKRKQTAARLKRRSSGECPDLDLNE